MTIIKGLKKLRQQFNELRAEAERNKDPSVVVGYTANYALYVHESVGMKLKGKPRPNNKGMFWDPQGTAQAKFLEAPARTLQPELARIVRDVTRKTNDLEQGLLAAGMRLKRESQKLCPVNTGNLKGSAFVRPGRL